MKIRIQKFNIIKWILITLILLIFLVANPLKSYQRWRYGVEEGVKLENYLVENMLVYELEDVIDKIALEKEVSLRNAFMDKKSGEVVPELWGRKIHRSLTIHRVMQAKPNTNVRVKMVEIRPEITEELLKSIEHPIGSYYTYIGGGVNGRINNIKLATNSFNNVLIAPGEIISFNRTTGPRAKRQGYQLAPVIVGEQVVPGLGGGVCQVSSTLYNAVLEAELEVIERIPHSRPVYYVPKGKDATVSDYIDFKFRNNTDKYLLIRTSDEGHRVNVVIFSN